MEKDATLQCDDVRLMFLDIVLVVGPPEVLGDPVTLQLNSQTFDRKTQTDRQTESQADRNTDRLAERQRQTWTGRLLD